MLPAHSPFPCHWWGAGLEAVALGELRPDRGTYGRYEFGRLPPNRGLATPCLLREPAQFCATFPDWLTPSQFASIDSAAREAELMMYMPLEAAQRDEKVQQR